MRSAQIHHRVWIATALILLLVLPAYAANPIVGKVIRVVDGDTLVVQPVGTQDTVRIRLASIDTPERGQPWGRRATQALSQLVAAQTVQVVPVDRDRYGRVVGVVYLGPLDVNRELVRQGHAWVYRRYNKDPSLLETESEARTAGRGLWSLNEAERTPPWTWRRNH